MRKIKYIVIHSSATRAIQADIGAKDIRKWHTDPKPRGRGWKTIAYHRVVQRGGKVEYSLALESIGNGVSDNNSNAVHICMVGGLNNDTLKPENNYTPAQWRALKEIVLPPLLKMFPGAVIMGHRNFRGEKNNKACPCFNAIAWAKANGFPAGPDLSGRG